MNSKIRIDKNVPMPKRENTGVAEVMSRLEIGDSFETDDTASLRGNVYNIAKQFGIRIAIRSVGGGMVRVWRILDERLP